MVVPRTVLVLALVMAGEALCADASLTNEDVVRLANAGVGVKKNSWVSLV